MASLITDDGRVHAPLTITAPAPVINLRGFKWRTVDQKIHAAPTIHDHGREEQAPMKEDAEVPTPQVEEVASAPAPTGESAHAREAHEPKHEPATKSESAPLTTQGSAVSTPASPPAHEQATATTTKAPFQAPVPAAVSQAPPAGPLPAPQLAAETATLPAQIVHQLRPELTHIPALPAPGPPPFPFHQFQGPYAGNGFNLIFRPRSSPDDTIGLHNPIPSTDLPDNILELNLTKEQITFGETIGGIPNRGLGLTNKQATINLAGLPYLQTVQDVTNTATGKGDFPDPPGIHFEPGMWLSVPASQSPRQPPSVVRMASIPHGTTINAQGVTPTQTVTAQTPLGGVAGPPNFDAPENTLDTTPFSIGNFNQEFRNSSLRSMTAELANTPRLPQDLRAFIAAGTITTPIIKNPNLVLKNAIQGQTIVETTTISVGTGPSTSPGSSTMNGGGTTNISFLNGTQNPITTQSPGANGAPNADAEFMTSKIWVETVAYQVTIPNLTAPPEKLFLQPKMALNSTAPTPTFQIFTGPGVKFPITTKTITVPGVQIQTSQTVNLNFAPLTWPHVSVSTLVPSEPQPFVMTS